MATRNLDEQGFTLIEVLIAVTVFAIGILAVAAMTMQAVNGNTSAAISTDSTKWASSALDTIMGLDFSVGPGDQGDPFKDNNNSIGASGQYQVSWSVLPGTVPNTRIVNVTITRKDVGGRQVETTYTYLKAKQVRTWK